MTTFKVQNFCSTKDTKKMKRQAIEQTMFSIPTTYKGLISMKISYKSYKNDSQPYRKIGQRFGQTLHKRKSKWPVNI